mgnify:CR=1 FL=1
MRSISRRFSLIAKRRDIAFQPLMMPFKNLLRRWARPRKPSVRPCLRGRSSALNGRISTQEHERSLTIHSSGILLMASHRTAATPALTYWCSIGIGSKHMELGNRCVFSNSSGSSGGMQISKPGTTTFASRQLSVWPLRNSSYEVLVMRMCGSLPLSPSTNNAPRRTPLPGGRIV